VEKQFWWKLAAAAALLCIAATAYASETTTYTYDSRGRLVAVNHSGTVNDNVSTSYTYDKADNRVNVTVSGVLGNWSPSILFGGGAQGAWYDPSDLSSMWQDSAGTTAAAVNSPVGRINDKSGNGHHLTQSTSGKRPYLRQSGSLYYLDFDGVDDRLFSAAFSASFAQSNMTALGAKTDATGPDYLVVDSTTDGSRNAIAISAFNPGQWIAWSGTDEVPLGSASTSAAQVVIATLNGSSTNGEVNGVSGSTGNGGTSAMNGISLGGRFSDNYFYDGRIYGLVVLDTPATGSDLAALRSWLGTPP
jgi:YD repeat-containing protein